MHNLVWLLTAGIEKCTISASNSCRLSDWVAQFSGPAIIVPQKCAKQSWRIVPRQKCAFLERKIEPSFSILRNFVSVKVEFGPRLAKIANGKMKENMKVNV